MEETVLSQEKQDRMNIPVDALGIPVPQKPSFSIDTVQIGDWFDGIVKLKYNYGLFVMVKGVEGLLHKGAIKVPDGIARKDVYNIGDKIRVKVSEFKEINGEKKVVRSQE
jgi:ribosomal protein S1